MGAAWCRDRAAAATNSKSPLDRVIVQCVTQICPSSESRPRGTRGPREAANEPSRTRNKHLIGDPVPVHTRNHPISGTHAINALSSWQDVSLSVPDSSDEGGPPVPPPRKKKIWREQQKLQSENWKVLPRPPPPEPPKSDTNQEVTKNSKKRRQKTLSSVSLPNYNDLSLSVYTPTNEKQSAGQKTPPRNESCVSLPGKGSGLSSFSEATVEKIENCVRRCRSFGAFKAEPLKLKNTPRNGRHSSESDDSFDGLDDWDLGVIEHCEAHEVSPVQTMLPPQRQRKANCLFNKGRLEGEHVQKKMPERLSNNFSSNERNLQFDTAQSFSLNSSEESSITIESSEAGYLKSSKGNEKVDEESVNSKIKPHLNSENDTANKFEDTKDPNDTINGDPSTDSKVVIYDFVNNIKRTDNEKPIVTNGFCGKPTDITTPPPSPESVKPKRSVSIPESDEQIGHSSLLRLLKEHQSADGRLEDSGAQNVLRGLGIPPTLKDTDVPAVHKPTEKITCTSRGSSGRSSMTPSLSELEAALSDLLEASASKTGADEDDDEVMPISLVTTTTTTPVQQTIRVISPKPYSSFSNSFHPIQNSPSKQVAETSA